MIKVFSKFKPGDKVYTLIQEPIEKNCRCDLCEGEGKIVHRDVTMKCPKCKGYSEVKFVSNFRCWVVLETPLPITSINLKYCSDNNYTIRYNLLGGYKRSQDNVFLNKENAIARCNELNGSLNENDCILPKIDLGHEFILETKYNVGDYVYINVRRVPQNPNSELTTLDKAERISEIRATIHSEDNYEVRYKVLKYNRREGGVFSTLEAAFRCRLKQNKLSSDAEDDEED